MSEMTTVALVGLAPELAERFLFNPATCRLVEVRGDLAHLRAAIPQDPLPGILPAVSGSTDDLRQVDFAVFAPSPEIYDLRPLLPADAPIRLHPVESHSWSESVFGTAEALGQPSPADRDQDNDDETAGLPQPRYRWLVNRFCRDVFANLWHPYSGQAGPQLLVFFAPMPLGGRQSLPALVFRELFRHGPVTPELSLSDAGGAGETFAARGSRVIEERRPYGLATRFDLAPSWGSDAHVGSEAYGRELRDHLAENSHLPLLNAAVRYLWQSSGGPRVVVGLRRQCSAAGLERDQVLVIMPNPDSLEQVLELTAALATATGMNGAGPKRFRDFQGFLHNKSPQHGFVGGSLGLFFLFKNLVNAILLPERHVLLLGETGTGKELIAGLLHKAGSPSNNLVVMNCAGLTEHLAVSQLFGYRKGAFSGANEDTEGLVEKAKDGVLFLDEIQAFPRGVADKLLRFLEDGSFCRVGEEGEMRKVRARVIAASNKTDMRRDPALVGMGWLARFSFVIELPPLRERRDDIPLLAKHFLAAVKRETQGEWPAQPEGVGDGSPDEWSPSTEQLRVWQQQDWLGTNVRGLRSAVESWFLDRLAQVKLDMNAGTPTAAATEGEHCGEREATATEDRIRTAGPAANQAGRGQTGRGRKKGMDDQMLLRILGELASRAPLTLKQLKSALTVKNNANGSCCYIATKGYPLRPLLARINRIKPEDLRREAEEYYKQIKEKLKPPGRRRGRARGQLDA